MSDVRDFLSTVLGTLGHIGANRDRLEEYARTQPRELALAIEALRPPPEAPDAEAGPHWVLARYVEYALGRAAGIEPAEALLRLGSLEVPPMQLGEMRRAFDSDIRRRWIAALLACGQSTSVALELLERNEDREDAFELRCLLLHEIAVRAPEGLDHEPVAARLVREMRGRGHRLTALPVGRVALESALVAPAFPTDLWASYPPMPEFSPRMGTPIRWPWMDTGRPRELPAGPASPPDERPELACVAFELPPEAEGTDDVSVLAWLPIEPLVPSPPGRSAQPLSASDAFALLFATNARAPGFPVNDTVLPRLHAWEQARYLLGAGATASPLDVDALAQAARWTRHAAVGGWFESYDIETALLLTARTGRRFATLVYCHSEPRT